MYNLQCSNTRSGLGKLFLICQDIKYKIWNLIIKLRKVINKQLPQKLQYNPHRITFILSMLFCLTTLCNSIISKFLFYILAY